MEKQDLLDLYATLKGNGDSVAEMIMDRSRKTFEDILKQYVKKGIKIGYEAAANDIQAKFREINLAKGFPEFDMYGLKNRMAGFNAIDMEDVKAFLAENRARYDFDFSGLKENALEGMQELGEFVDNAEAGVLAKMAELKEAEISERDKKIAIMAVCAAVALIVSAVVLKKKHKKKKAIMKQMAEDARALEAEFEAEEAEVTEEVTEAEVEAAKAEAEAAEDEAEAAEAEAEAAEAEAEAVEAEAEAVEAEVEDEAAEVEEAAEAGAEEN